MSDEISRLEVVSYHNDPAVKTKYVERMRGHIKADALVRGLGWDSKKKRGCAVGCTLENYDHAQYPIELGVPEWLARLEDTLFENLPEKDAKTFPPVQEDGKFLSHVNTTAGRIHVNPPLPLQKGVQYGVRLFEDLTVDVWRLEATGIKGEIQ